MFNIVQLSGKSAVPLEKFHGQLRQLLGCLVKNSTQLEYSGEIPQFFTFLGHWKNFQIIYAQQFYICLLMLSFLSSFTFFRCLIVRASLSSLLFSVTDFRTSEKIQLLPLQILFSTCVSQPVTLFPGALTCSMANCQYGCDVVKGQIRCQCPSPGLQLAPDGRTCVGEL